MKLLLFLAYKVDVKVRMGCLYTCVIVGESKRLVVRYGAREIERERENERESCVFISAEKQRFVAFGLTKLQSMILG